MFQAPRTPFLALLLLLGACATVEDPGPATPAALNPQPEAEQPVSTDPVATDLAADPEPEPQPEPPALLSNDLIGLEPRAVQEIFGPVSLKRWEGQAQVMQFANEHCVIDVFFYEAAPGDAFEATFIDSRNHSGDAIDADVCVASLIPGGTWAGIPEEAPRFGK